MIIAWLLFGHIGFGYTLNDEAESVIVPFELVEGLISFDKEPISSLRLVGIRSKIDQPPGTVIKIALKKKDNTQYEVNLVLKDIL